MPAVPAVPAVQAVVVGCDTTPDGDPALRFAAEEARCRGARLVVVSAYERPRDPDVDDFDTPDAARRERAAREVERSLQRALGGAGSLPDHDTVCVPGDPVRALLDAGRDAVMIVIGSHDHPARRWLSGRLADRQLLHHSHVPVTVVPASPRTDR